jgi:hypothetical protein
MDTISSVAERDRNQVLSSIPVLPAKKEKVGTRRKIVRSKTVMQIYPVTALN